jgi:hypothetical protein
LLVPVEEEGGGKGVEIVSEAVANLEVGAGGISGRDTRNKTGWRFVADPVKGGRGVRDGPAG